MKRLTRSNTNKVFSGILGGLGEYFGIDATILRLIFVFITFANIFTGLIIYGLASFIIPEDDNVFHQDSSYDNTRDNSVVFIGGGLILLGIVLLARMYLPALNIIFPNYRIIMRQIRNLWPALLIIAGVLIIIRQKKDY